MAGRRFENFAEVVRSRPGMWVGDPDGAGIAHLAFEILGNAYDQYLAGRCTAIDVDVGNDGSITVTDDGPGMCRDRLPPLDTLLTVRSDQPTVDGHQPHTHLVHGGLGLVIVNAVGERVDIVTVSDGVETRGSYARGIVVEPASSAPTTSRNGTVIRFHPDPEIFTSGREVDRASLIKPLEDLAFLSPRLTLRWRFPGEPWATARSEFTRAGLAGLVALHARCEISEVASHRARYETKTGPFDVEVALTFTDTPRPRIDSFVNLARTRDGGKHVTGLRAAVLAAGRDPKRMVAAVSVILADVIWGNPSKDRLKSLGIRAVVHDATTRALANRE